MNKLFMLFSAMAIICLSHLAHASTPLQTYQGLQSLKLNVRDAYVYALIVNVDDRAHVERNKHLDNIGAITAQIANSELLESSIRSELNTRLHVYLRSAKSEAANYDINLGSRTASNGYTAYAELIDQIEIAMRSLESESSVPSKWVKSFSLMDNIAISVEIHAERAVKTQRAEQISQQSISAICADVKKGLSALAQFSDAKTTVKKANLKWSFIQTPACKISKTNAPFTIVYYGDLMIKGLLEYAATDQP